MTVNIWGWGRLMPTTAWDIRFMRRMIAMMLTGAALLVVGVLLEPLTKDAHG